jgi:hypothetical protein
MSWYMEGNKEQGWRGVEYLTPNIVHILVCSMCLWLLWYHAISPLILIRRWVDWCIHQLLGYVLSHYWYQSLRKNWGFVPNRKHEQFIINVVFHAKDFPNSCVIFPKDNCGYAIITSLKHQDVHYKVYNLESKWAYYECLQLQRGNIYKHQIKLLMFLHHDLTTIAHYCGLLSETLNSGLNKMVSLCLILRPCS